MDRCVVKNCNFSLVLNDLFCSPQDEKLLKQWQQAVKTKSTEFSVCEQHFAKKDLNVEKFLQDEAIPTLHLNDEIIRLDRDCCGFCLEDLEVKHEIQQQFKNSFKEICGYEPLTNYMCRDCKYGLLKYKKFKTEIQSKHANIRAIARNKNQAEKDSTVEEINETEEHLIEEETVTPEQLNLVEVIVPKEKPAKSAPLPTQPDPELEAIRKSNQLNMKLVEQIKKPKLAIIEEKKPQETVQEPPKQLEPSEFISKIRNELLQNATPLKLSRKSALVPKKFSKDEDNIMIVACEYCFEEVPEDQLEKHFQKAHAPKDSFLCHVCSQEFKEERRLKNHVKYHYPDEMMYNCDLCGRVVALKHKFVEHMQGHLGINKRSVQCKICLKVINKRSQPKKGYKYHMKLYHKNGYDCGARVNSETNYFDCDQCGASYADLFTYRRHDCEKGRFQLRCPDCQKPIRNAEKMRIHQKNQCKTYDRTTGIWYYWKGARFKK